MAKWYLLHGPCLFKIKTILIWSLEKPYFIKYIINIPMIKKNIYIRDKVIKWIKAI